jgi:hypothetical protein
MILATRRGLGIKQNIVTESVEDQVEYTPLYNIGSNQAASREEGPTALL